MPYHVSKADFAQMLEEALVELPEPFAAAVEELSIEIRDWPSSEQEKKIGLKRGGLLLGLYQGIPTTRRSVFHSGTLPEVIYLFQQPIERVCQNSEQLVQQIRTTV